MRTVRNGPLIGLIAQAAVLAVLAGTVGLGGAGWTVGLASGTITALALTRGLPDCGAGRLGPADWVTLTRSTLVGGAAALAADSFSLPTPVAVLVTLSAIALVLDAVDGQVARRTGTVSALGARFDMEVDAFLILVLSVYLVGAGGPWWVLIIGGARYGYVAAGRLLPWLRGSLPPRRWRKVVAAVQGLVLTVAAAGVLAPWLTTAVLAGSLALLTESFGRDVRWRWRRRAPAAQRSLADDTGRPPRAVRPPGLLRSIVSTTLSVVAGLLVWIALLAPNQLPELTPVAFLRIPVEGLIAGAALLALPPRVRRIPAALAGALLGVLTLLKVLDMGFSAALDRPFQPLSDWSYAGSALGVLSDSVGPLGAVAGALVAALLTGSVLVLLPLAVLRLTRLAAAHRVRSMRAITAMSSVWILCAIFGVQFAPGTPIASASAARLVYDQARQVRGAIQDQQVFAQTVTDDPFRDTQPARLLTGLRGKDVVIAFVESYGRVAVQDSAVSTQVDTVLETGTGRLQAAGFSARSAFLTSPTFGGISWLAHSTLQSGLWIDNQQRYDDLVTGSRFTLSAAFKNAGWRTVGDVPSNERDWPEGTSFYHYDTIYDERNVGYLGPSFSYASMPDQYVLSAFAQRELARPEHPPVMAEIDLVSSHSPWAPLPTMVGWPAVGDGSVFTGMPATGHSPQQVWSDPGQVVAAYGQSIEYSLSTLIGFVQTYGNDDLVLIVVGDHQPATIVSGLAPSHDVPISVIAHDPAVMNRISGWGWQTGLLPGPHAPVWRMDSFRDRLLTAFGTPKVDPGALAHK